MKKLSIKTVIVEDELAAQQVLVNYLNKYCPIIEVIGIANNGLEGIQLIQDLDPQLVFLDVEMPFANAFDVLEACNDKQFHTIFVTAYSNYAIQALNMSAAYYLLKPLNIEELIAAVHKVQEHINAPKYFNANEVVIHNLHHQQELQQLVLPTVEGFDVVAVKDVVRLKGNGNFTNVYTQDGKNFMVCRFLKHFESLLPAHFLRVHKSHIVNKLFIQSYHKGCGGYITLYNKVEVEVSATYKDYLLQHFK